MHIICTVKYYIVLHIQTGMFNKSIKINSTIKWEYKVNDNICKSHKYSYFVSICRVYNIIWYE